MLRGHGQGKEGVVGGRGEAVGTLTSSIKT